MRAVARLTSVAAVCTTLCVGPVFAQTCPELAGSWGYGGMAAVAVSGSTVYAGSGTVLLVVSITELLDFFEGLASAVITLISLVFFHLQIAKGQGEVYVPFFFAVLGGAAAGLLPFQLFRKKILYGKSGNKLVGFLFAAGTVIARRKETTGQFFLFPIALLLFATVVVHFLFLESQLRPISPGKVEK